MFGQCFLVEKMRFTEENLRELKVLFSDSINELIKSDTFMSKVLNIVKEHFIVELETLKEGNEQLKKENKLLSEKLDDIEQYNRRNSVRVFGVGENKQENLESEVLTVLNRQLGLSIVADNIDRCHRVGRFSKTNTNPRGIIVKFTSYKYRDLVCKARRKLKGSGITIQEDLTVTRYRLLRQAMDKFGKTKCWSMDGRIYTEYEQSKIRIKGAADLENVHTERSRLTLTLDK